MPNFTTPQATKNEGSNKYENNSFWHKIMQTAFNPAIQLFNGFKNRYRETVELTNKIDSIRQQLKQMNPNISQKSLQIISNIFASLPTNDLDEMIEFHRYWKTLSPQQIQQYRTEKNLTNYSLAFKDWQYYSSITDSPKSLPVTASNSVYDEHENQLTETEKKFKIESKRFNLTDISNSLNQVIKSEQRKGVGFTDAFSTIKVAQNFALKLPSRLKQSFGSTVSVAQIAEQLGKLVLELSSSQKSEVYYARERITHSPAYSHETTYSQPPQIANEVKEAQFKLVDLVAKALNVNLYLDERQLSSQQNSRSRDIVKAFVASNEFGYRSSASYLPSNTSNNSR